MQPAITEQHVSRAASLASITTLCLSCFTRSGQPRRSIASRVRITIEGGGPASVVELPVAGPPRVVPHATGEAHDVEIITSEPIVRAIAVGRSPIAMLLLGHLRVRGNLAHIDELARTLVHEDARHG